MTGPGPGLALATAAAVATNGAYLLQHAALRSGPPLAARGLSVTLRALLCSRDWLRGALLGYMGLGAQIAALALVPLWIVQAIMAAGLVVALGGWARRGRREDPARLAVALTLLGAGLLAVVVGGVQVQAPTGVPLGTLAVFAAVVTGTALALPAVRGARPPVNALAAGLLYGVTTAGIAAALALPGRDLLLAGVVLAVAGTCAMAGLVRFQRALQADDPVPVVLLMSAAMNSVAMLGGVLLAQSGAPGLVASAGIGALCAAGFVVAVPAGWATRAAAVTLALVCGLGLGGCGGQSPSARRASAHVPAPVSSRPSVDGRASIGRLVAIARRRWALEQYGPPVYLLLRRVAADPALARALHSRDPRRVRAVVRRRFRTVYYHWHVSRLRVVRHGRTVVDAGVPFVIAAASRVVPGTGGLRLEVSDQDVVGFVRFMHRNHHVDVVARGRTDAHVRTSLPAALRVHLPARGSVRIAGREYGVGTLVRRALGGERVRIWVLARR